VSEDIIFHEETYPFNSNENKAMNSTLEQFEGWMHDDEFNNFGSPAVKGTRPIMLGPN